MKRVIGLLVLGLIFGLSICFGAGNFDEETTKALDLEVERLANGVNFDNLLEVRAFENALRRSNALNEYITANKALATTLGLELTEDYIIDQTVQDQRSRQERLTRQIIEQRKLIDAEAWSGRNVIADAILLDSHTQKAILEVGKQNSFRATQSLEKYENKLTQYSGKVERISQHLISKRWFISLRVVGTEGDWVSSVRVFMEEGRDMEISELNEGDCITVVGEFWGAKLEAGTNNTYIRFDLEDSRVLHIIK